MLRKFILGASAALVMSGTAHAAEFTNGSFELGSPQPSVGGFSTLNAGDTSITGWTVYSGSVDWINSYWNAYDGTHSVDLAGNVPGAIEQTFDTVAGQLYKVDYWASGNPDGGGPLKNGVVAAINGATVFDFATFYGPQGSDHNNMNYVLYSFGFTAQGTSTTLRFSSGPDEGAYGAALYKVSVQAVPEPTTWAMMLVGFGVVGASMRRRAKRHPLQLA